jgi:hypothetical protein
MAEATRIVVRFADGRTLKGTTQDFFPNRPSFHVLPTDGSPGIEVRCRELKAVFFVRSFEGSPGRKDDRGFVAAPSETAQGQKIAVRFKDGELLCGYSLAYTPDRAGFFMFPADGGSNNTRAFIVRTATAEVKTGPAAEALVLRLAGKQP